MDVKNPLPRPPNPGLPYREDCWSEGETSALVEAWGDRYVELNRGNLRQKHWQEVADAVNHRPGAAGRPTRTDVQCKNRIDTLKKKYKVEKAKNSISPSQWPFFSRLDFLIGASVTPSGQVVPKKQLPLSSSPPLALALPFHRKAGSPLPAAVAAAEAAAAAARPMEIKREHREEFKRPLAGITVDDMILRRAQAAAAAAEEEKDEEEDEEEEDDEVETGSPSGSSSFRGIKRGAEGEGVRELAGAIMRFAEIYERVEIAKQRQMMELEKQRMEFTKELEFQRMQMFVDSQVQLEKFKRAKRSDHDNYL